MSDELKTGYINIQITDEGVVYQSEYSYPEVIFWLETLKLMMLKGILDTTEPIENPETE